MSSIPSSALTCQAPATEARLPDCFNDHNAAQSVVKLFEAWVGAADKTLNGIIAINLRHEPYSHTTVSKAINWLLKHRLMMKTEAGGGRGVASRFFVRWSFDYQTLRQRRRAAYAEINAEKPAGYRITGNSYMYAREEALRLLEEQHEAEKHSLNIFKTSTDVSRMENSKREAFAKANSEQRRLRNERATRWAMAQLRKVSDDPDALEASAKAIRRSLANGDVWIGPELAQFVSLLAYDLESLNDGEVWPVSRRDTFSYIGFATWSVGLRIYGDRRNAAEYQQREQERQEAIRDPLPTEFSCRSENGVATPSARRQVATDGAVVCSDNRERRQAGEVYQRPGNQHRANTHVEHPADVYESDPVNIADMMGDYLEKLGRDDHAMERKDRIETAKGGD